MEHTQFIDELQKYSFFSEITFHYLYFMFKKLPC